MSLQGGYLQTCCALQVFTHHVKIARGRVESLHQLLNVPTDAVLGMEVRFECHVQSSDVQ
jgi:hypothetical protein